MHKKRLGREKSILLCMFNYSIITKKVIVKNDKLTTLLYMNNVVNWIIFKKFTYIYQVKVRGTANPETTSIHIH